MAVTTAYSGSHVVQIRFTATLSGDKSGLETVKDDLSITWAAAGGTAPTLTGALYGPISVTGAQDILLAHATDPLQGTGDATYTEGGTPSAGVSKLKFLRVRNTHATATLAVARKAANGLPIFSAASDAIVIEPGGYWDWYAPAGSAALTTGSNDGLTLTPSAGTVTGFLMAAYGP